MRWFFQLQPVERLFLLWGLCMHVIAFFYATGYQHGDEHFQIMEFAAYKLNICTYESLAWEYPAQMRPGLQPFIVFGIANITRSLTGEFDAFLVSDVLRAISLLLGFVSLLLLHRLSISFRLGRNQSLVLAFLVGLGWFFPYLHARFSSENFSGIFLIYAIYFAFRNGLDKKNFSSTNWFLSGICWGLSFEFRFQIGFAAIGFLAWLIYSKKASIKPMLLLIFGGMLVLSFSVFIDHWLYNAWCFPPLNYFNEVLFKTDSMFGRNPWYDFLPLSLNWLGLSVGSLFIIVLILALFRKPQNPLGWMFLAFVLIHNLLDHKEMRFLFPAVYLTPLILAAAIPESILQRGKDLFLNQFKYCAIAVIVFVSALKSIACSTTYASPDVDAFKTIANYVDLKGPQLVYCPYDIGYVMAHYYEFRFFRTKGANLRFYSNDYQLKAQIKNGQKGLILVWGEHTEWPARRTFKLIYDSMSEWQNNNYLRGSKWNRDRYRIYEIGAL
jgi:phosphatidylinositol glycan class B